MTTKLPDPPERIRDWLGPNPYPLNSNPAGQLVESLGWAAGWIRRSWTHPALLREAWCVEPMVRRDATRQEYVIAWPVHPHAIYTAIGPASRHMSSDSGMDRMFS